MELDVLTKAYLTKLSHGKTDYSETAIDRLSSTAGLVAFYKGQLRKFDKVGLGNYTEFNVQVTPELIAVTIKRLEELYRVKLNKVTA
ncbi:MAG: hypothetical protein H8E74_02065 [Gammaproteobacteria bacterium]|nr:hypothetical protein [Gammaproteobacteria bacterium]